jgi:hypothetical protein
MKVKGFLLEGEGDEEFLISVQPAGRTMFQQLTVRGEADSDWTDATGLASGSQTLATTAVLNYLHRLWQMSGPIQVLDH